MSDDGLTFSPSFGPRSMRQLIKRPLVRVRIHIQCVAPHERVVTFALDAQVHAVGTLASKQKTEKPVSTEQIATLSQRPHAKIVCYCSASIDHVHFRIASHC